MLIDSHCHLNFSSFKDDYQEIIADCLDKEIGIVNVGADLNSSMCAVEIAKDYNNVYATIGLHPTEAEEFEKDKYQELLNNNQSKIIAIGEIGLDYYYQPEKEKQKQIFIQQLNFAGKNNLPVVLHARGSKENPQDAYLDMLEILCKNTALPCSCKGVIHCFGSTLKIAQKFIDLNFYIGFTGIITFKNKSVDELKNVVKNVDLNKILIETYAPYLTPEPYRGEKNKPQYVEFVAKKIADIKNISYDVVAKATTENFKNLFF